jgi:site-specific DNA-cytosine methylase
MLYDYEALFLASGMGLGAYGFQNATAKLGEDTARFRIVGGVDNDPGSNADFYMLTGVKPLEYDLHELAPARLRQYVPRCPDAVFSSSPCKGYSQLLKKATALTPFYQRMNELVYRCIMLSCETWDERPGLIALENVPGIVTRGKDVLDRSKKLLRYYGYDLHEGSHDCGEIGNLAQHRRRYLLVARHMKRVRNFVHKPLKHTVRACGDELVKLPVPIGGEGAEAGVLHRMPNIAWITWVKLSLIPAGGDHRDLPRDFKTKFDASKFDGAPGLMKVGDFAQPFPTVTANPRVTGSNGAAAVADPRVPPEFYSNVTAVMGWGQPSRVVTGGTRPSGGGLSVADPRGRKFGNAFMVEDWNKPTHTVIGQQEIATGALSVADPRVPTNHPTLGVMGFGTPAGAVQGESLPSNGRFSVADPRLLSPLKPGQARRDVQGRFDIRGFEQPAHTVAGSGSNGGYGVADPRPGRGRQFNNHCAVRGFDQPALSVIGASQPDSGAQAVAEVRLRNGQYGVLSWQQAAGTITGQCSIDNGSFSVSDPRKPVKGSTPVIISADGCWHRPLTTLELGLLQGLPLRIRGKAIELHGTSSLRWRERIGNAVPEGAGRAVATSLLKALLASTLGTWFLSNDEIWVRQVDHYVMPEDRGEAQVYQ